MSKLFKDRLRDIIVLSLLIVSSVSLLAGCTPKIDESKEVSTELALESDAESEVTEGLVLTTTGEKLSTENKILVEDMLKRMEIAINRNDTALFSDEFKLLMADYTDQQINDINTKLLAFVEEKHNFYFYELLDENVDENGKKVVIVRMGYKNLDDKEEINEYVQMLVELNEQGQMKVSKIFFLDEEQYAAYK